ncbi:H(+)/Cl(-) exchange transporter 3 [Biomphalaria pfeifferi]|uniref:H(+)/Cl(-) exchange transporter 3 n=1 Tax=Biomphalaria pfeifferi TaxID=112525 RepID=A0AAD8BRL2_BIOPF|nr:H(+)/Cl(-) exchange transporter 3 [Biomphalaria pfeifferi]
MMEHTETDALLVEFMDPRQPTYSRSTGPIRNNDRSAVANSIDDDSLLDMTVDTKDFHHRHYDLDGHGRHFGLEGHRYDNGSEDSGSLQGKL